MCDLFYHATTVILYIVTAGRQAIVIVVGCRPRIQFDVGLCVNGVENTVGKGADSRVKIALGAAAADSPGHNTDQCGGGTTLVDVGVKPQQGTPRADHDAFDDAIVQRLTGRRRR